MSTRELLLPKYLFGEMAEMAQYQQYHSATMVKQYQPSCASYSAIQAASEAEYSSSSRSKRGCCFELNVSHEKGRRAHLRAYAA